MVNKDDLIRLGFKPSIAGSIIRQAKVILAKDYPFYDNRRLGLVPKETVEQIIGTSLDVAEEYYNPNYNSDQEA